MTKSSRSSRRTSPICSQGCAGFTFGSRRMPGPEDVCRGDTGPRELRHLRRRRRTSARSEQTPNHVEFRNLIKLANGRDGGVQPAERPAGLGGMMDDEPPTGGSQQPNPAWRHGNRRRHTERRGPIESAVRAGDGLDARSARARWCARDQLAKRRTTRWRRSRRALSRRSRSTRAVRPHLRATRRTCSYTRPCLGTRPEPMSDSGMGGLRVPCARGDRPVGAAAE